MTNLLRKGDGQPLRDAMKAAGVSGPELARATRRVDPAGRGVSPAIIGRMAGRGRSAREQCRLRTAWLIADALGQPLQRLFSMPECSTATVERSIPDAEEG
ncbi:XRE family transcriptional regulator [Streptomyces roseoverticillatus]|uniref:XRE family transcriptional regulator n=1 Tax=Streptomyces roseoverticillatus TaxID=66429 RepID=UPI001F2ECD35|nr:XRE family transcriptional regulator [Streptomyces roseoverticillatus]MCF3101493.1 XRE family transcriptional regulator [Streptomyces roseoverticillatus]